MKTPIFRSYTVFESAANDYRAGKGLPPITVDRSVPLSLLSSLYSEEYDYKEHINMTTINCISILKSVEHETDLLTPAKTKKFAALLKDSMSGRKPSQKTWFHANDFNKLSAVLDMERAMPGNLMVNIRQTAYNGELGSQVTTEFAYIISQIIPRYSQGSLLYGLLTYLFSCMMLAYQINEEDSETWTAALEPYLVYSEARGASMRIWQNL